MPVFHGYDFSDWIHPRACKTCGFIVCKCSEAQKELDALGEQLAENHRKLTAREDELGESPTETRTLTDF